MVAGHVQGDLIRSLVRIPGSGWDTLMISVTLDLGKMSDLVATIPVPSQLPQALIGSRNPVAPKRIHLPPPKRVSHPDAELRALRKQKSLLRQEILLLRQRISLLERKKERRHTNDSIKAVSEYHCVLISNQKNKYEYREAHVPPHWGKNGNTVSIIFIINTL